MKVEDVLKNRGIPFIVKGRDLLIHCLNPEHDDSHPSMRIDQVTGIFNCFACGHKGNLFRYFGEEPNELQVARDSLRSKIEEKMLESIGLQFPSDMIPYRGDWRNIKPETYAHFEAFESTQPDFISRVVFPVRNIMGNIVAFQGRHTSGGVPKYLFSPKHVKVPLFPTVEPYQGSVILVEGMFDMLNLFDKGVPNSVACFGVSTVTQEKIRLLKIRNTEEVVIFFDGDKAGQEGALKVKKLVEECGLRVRNICLDEHDPGDLSQSQVNELMRKLYK